jgi:phenylacetate-CoA ligase
VPSSLIKMLSPTNGANAGSNETRVRDRFPCRVGEATKVRGMFIAPSQLKVVSSRFGELRLQAIVDREGFKDILTMRVEAEKEGPDRARLDRRFENVFKEICTVKIDKLEFIEKGTLTEKDGLIDDRREWK